MAFAFMDDSGCRICFVPVFFTEHGKKEDIQAEH
jgi:hypothetical protein